MEDRCLLSGGINEFPAGVSQPLGITAGPDGNLWYTGYGSDQVATMDVFGNLLAQNSLASGSHPWGITAGPNDYLWFTENGRNNIGRINADTRQLDEYPIRSRYTTNPQPMGIATDVAGRIWSAESNINAQGFWVIDTDLSTCEKNLPGFMVYSNPREITLKSDGWLWFTGYARSGSSSGSFVGRMSGDCHGGTAHWETQYYQNPSYQGVTEGPDGTMWVLEDNANAIGHYEGDVSLLETIPISTANSHPREIIAGPDGSLWFTEYGASQIGRVTFNGDGTVTLTEYAAPTPDSGPFGITVGADGNIWFTEYLANQIGQIVLDTNPLTAMGLSLIATTGVPFTGSVASFSDSDPMPGPAANYAAVIDWGDGMSTSTGDINDDGGGNFDVVGGHTYAQAGSYTVTVTITDNDTDHDIGGVTTTASSTVDVEDAGGGMRKNQETRAVEVAAVLRAEPIASLLSVRPAVGNAAELASRATTPLIHPPLPTSALEVWGASANRPLAQHSAMTTGAVSRAAALPDLLAPAPLDVPGVDLTL